MSDETLTAGEIRILKLIAAGFLNAQGGTPAAGTHGPLQPLPDAQLDKEWADKIIKKDPPRYNGPSFVGGRYSSATPEWHDVNASYFAWKADKGRSESPVRLKDNGKPWFESDEFESKLSLAWAKRLRSNGATAAAAKTAEPESAWAGDDPEIPF